MSIAKKIKTTIIGVLLTICCLFATLPAALTAYAATPVDGEDGTYNVSYSIAEGGMVSKMLGRYMANPAVVEKIGNNYYLSVTQLSSSMENLSLNLESGKQVGYEITSDDGSNKTYRFTVSKENLSKGLPFSVYVSLRKETYSFTINLDLSGATRTGDIADSKTDRPGKFVPVISTTAGDEYEVARGQTFTIPSASAALGDETVDVNVSAYYVRNGEKTDIEITDNKLTLENAGEYHIVYRADRYRRHFARKYKADCFPNRRRQYDLQKGCRKNGKDKRSFSGVRRGIDASGRLFGNARKSGYDRFASELYLHSKRSGSVSSRRGRKFDQTFRF